MNKTKTHASIHIIYWITVITYWIFIVGASFGVLLGLGMLFNITGNDLNLHVGLPVEFNVLETGRLAGYDGTVNLIQATGKIGFTEVPPQLRVTYSIIMLMVIGITFYIFNTFRLFIKNVYRGIIFQRNNIQLLKRIAYGLVVVWGFIVVYTTIQYFALANHLSFETVEMTANLNFYPVVLLAALFLWVLSHIFMHGKELEDESNLTI